MLDYNTKAHTIQQVAEASPESVGVKSTDSYLAVPHLSVVKTIEKKVKKEIKKGCLKNFKIVSNEQHLNGSNKQMFGKMILEHNDLDSENGNALRFCIGYRNSYDKSLPLQLVFGSVVVVCSNMMFQGENFSFRKHTKGKAENESEAKFYEDFKNLLDKAIKKGVEIHNLNHETRNEWQKTYFKDDSVLAEFLGGLVFCKNGAEVHFKKGFALNNQQLSILKSEIDNPKHSEFERDELSRKFSVWAVYNCITEALKKSRPELVSEQYLSAHNYMDYFVKFNSERFENQEIIDEINEKIEMKKLEEKMKNEI